MCLPRQRYKHESLLVQRRMASQESREASRLVLYFRGSRRYALVVGATRAPIERRIYETDHTCQKATRAFPD
jgi:hypothetical protein